MQLIVCFRWPCALTKSEIGPAIHWCRNKGTVDVSICNEINTHGWKSSLFWCPWQTKYQSQWLPMCFHSNTMERDGNLICVVNTHTTSNEKWSIINTFHLEDIHMADHFTLDWCKCALHSFWTTLQRARNVTWCLSISWIGFVGEALTWSNVAVLLFC